MKPQYYIFSIALVIAGSVAAYFVVPAYAKYQRSNREKERLERHLMELRLEKQDRENTIHALRTSPQAVERVAREKFGWCRDNEKIYRFDAARQPNQLHGAE